MIAVVPRLNPFVGGQEVRAHGGFKVVVEHLQIVLFLQQLIVLLYEGHRGPVLNQIQRCGGCTQKKTKIGR